MKYISHNDFFTMPFSQRLSQRLSHYVFLTPFFLHNVFRTPFPYIFVHTTQSSVLTTSQYTRNLSVLYKYPKISQIRLSSYPRLFDNCWSIKLKPQRCTSAIYIMSLCVVSEPQDRGFIPKCRGQSTAPQMLTDGRNGIVISLSQIGWLGAKHTYYIRKITEQFTQNQ